MESRSKSPKPTASKPNGLPPNTALVAMPQRMTGLQVCQNASNLNALGTLFAQSGFFGSKLPAVSTAALINCFIEGLSPVQYRAKYHTMEDGSTTIKSDYIQREFHKLGGKWRFKEWTNEVCEIEYEYDGNKLTGRVTLDEFKANGVALGKGGALKTNWAKFPKEMLKARCMATYIRALCPEALEGMYLPEEIGDAIPDETLPPPVVDAPSASPLASEAAAIDPSVCPSGKLAGRKWADMPTAHLEKALTVDFPEECKRYIRAIIHDRESKASTPEREQEVVDV